MAQSRFAQEGNKLSQLLQGISVSYNEPELGQMSKDAHIDLKASMKMPRNKLTEMIAGFVVQTDKLAVSIDGPTLPPMGTPADMSQSAPIANVENSPALDPNLRG